MADYLLIGDGLGRLYLESGDPTSPSFLLLDVVSVSASDSTTTTPGDYSFTWPDRAPYIIVRCTGAGAGSVRVFDNSINDYLLVRGGGGGGYSRVKLTRPIEKDVEKFYVGNKGLAESSSNAESQGEASWFGRYNNSIKIIGNGAYRQQGGTGAYTSVSDGSVVLSYFLATGGDGCTADYTYDPSLGLIINKCGCPGHPGSDSGDGADGNCGYNDVNNPCDGIPQDPGSGGARCSSINDGKDGSVRIVVEAPGSVGIKFTVQPTNTPVNIVITPPIEVSSYFVNYNVLGGNESQVTISKDSNSPGGTLSGTLTKNVVEDHLFVFDDIKINQAGTGYKLVAASSPNNYQDTSSSFDIFVNLVNLNSSFFNTPDYSPSIVNAIESSLSVFTGTRTSESRSSVYPNLKTEDSIAGTKASSVDFKNNISTSIPYSDSTLASLKTNSYFSLNDIYTDAVSSVASLKISLRTVDNVTNPVSSLATTNTLLSTTDISVEYQNNTLTASSLLTSTETSTRFYSNILAASSFLACSYSTANYDINIPAAKLYLLTQDNSTHYHGGEATTQVFIQAFWDDFSQNFIKSNLDNKLSLNLPEETAHRSTYKLAFISNIDTDSQVNSFESDFLGSKITVSSNEINNYFDLNSLGFKSTFELNLYATNYYQSLLSTRSAINSYTLNYEYGSAFLSLLLETASDIRDSSTFYEATTLTNKLYLNTVTAETESESLLLGGKLYLSVQDSISTYSQHIPSVINYIYVNDYQIEYSTLSSVITLLLETNFLSKDFSTKLVSFYSVINSIHRVPQYIKSAISSSLILNTNENSPRFASSKLIILATAFLSDSVTISDSFHSGVYLLCVSSFVNETSEENNGYLSQSISSSYQETTDLASTLSVSLSSTTSSVDSFSTGYLASQLSFKTYLTSEDSGISTETNKLSTLSYTSLVLANTESSLHFLSVQGELIIWSTDHQTNYESSTLDNIMSLFTEETQTTAELPDAVVALSLNADFSKSSFHEAPDPVCGVIAYSDFTPSSISAQFVLLAFDYSMAIDFLLIEDGKSRLKIGSGELDDLGYLSLDPYIFSEGDYIQLGPSSWLYTIPDRLPYITAEVLGGGAGVTSKSGYFLLSVGGGGGGYARSILTRDIEFDTIFLKAGGKGLPAEFFGETIRLDSEGEPSYITKHPNSTDYFLYASGGRNRFGGTGFVGRGTNAFVALGGNGCEGEVFYDSIVLYGCGGKAGSAAGDGEDGECVDSSTFCPTPQDYGNGGNANPFWQQHGNDGYVRISWDNPYIFRKIAFIQHPGTSYATEAIKPYSDIVLVNSFYNYEYPQSIGLVTISIEHDPNGGLATLSGTLSNTPREGSWIFEDLSIDLSGKGYKLRATADLTYNLINSDYDISDPFDILIFVDLECSFSSNNYTNRNFVSARTPVETSYSSNNYTASEAIAGVIANSLDNRISVGYNVMKISPRLRAIIQNNEFINSAKIDFRTGLFTTDSSTNQEAERISSYSSIPTAYDYSTSTTYDRLAFKTGLFLPEVNLEFDNRIFLGAKSAAFLQEQEISRDSFKLDFTVQLVTRDFNPLDYQSLDTFYVSISPYPIETYTADLLDLFYDVTINLDTQYVNVNPLSIEFLERNKDFIVRFNLRPILDIRWRFI